MKDFFAKHFYRILIGFSAALLLAILIIPQFPPKLDITDYASCTVSCLTYRKNKETQILFRGLTETLYTKELEEIFTLLKDAPQQRCGKLPDREDLCQFTLKPLSSGPQYPRKSVSYTLFRTEGRYGLSTDSWFNKKAAWYISDESAQLLMEYCFCSIPSADEPRAYLCDPAHINAATLQTWSDRVRSDPVALTTAQIETVCSFLEERLLPVSYHYSQLTHLIHGENGWQLVLSAQDGLTWYVQFNDEQNCLSLCCAPPDGNVVDTAGYAGFSADTLSTLPELLNN
ncbi:MAG: hypothetical protein E7449_06435 [Ruminococcaceae bacterium]|nr:hypothetical protein [Oscillospiraceae bacterium]